MDELRKFQMTNATGNTMAIGSGESVQIKENQFQGDFNARSLKSSFNPFSSSSFTGQFSDQNLACSQKDQNFGGAERNQLYKLPSPKNDLMCN